MLKYSAFYQRKCLDLFFLSFWPYSSVGEKLPLKMFRILCAYSQLAITNSMPISINNSFFLVISTEFRSYQFDEYKLNQKCVSFIIFIALCVHACLLSNCCLKHFIFYHDVCIVASSFTFC